ncbi:MAG TPA: hypothetical protein VJ963_07145, partial [Bacteroidales bacterium]|nr:hypothetical protein [Bacteroidales bacterium]
LGIIAYTAMKYYGNAYYKDYIENMYGLAGYFAQLINSNPLFELAVEPMSNIVCFRYLPYGSDDSSINRFNEILRDTIVRDGSFYIVQTEIEGRIWLRTTIINPATTRETLRDLLEKITAIAETLTI